LLRAAPLYEKVSGADDPFTGIHTEGIGAPAFADLDGDGKLDLIVYDSVADVRDASTRGEVFVFLSHQWLGWSEPDLPRTVNGTGQIRNAFTSRRCNKRCAR